MSLANGKFDEDATTCAFAVVATPSSAQLPITHHFPAAAASDAIWHARVSPPASDGYTTKTSHASALISSSAERRPVHPSSAAIGTETERRTWAIPCRSKSGTGCSTYCRSNCSSARIHLTAAGTLQFMFASIRILTSEPTRSRIAASVS